MVEKMLRLRDCRECENYAGSFCLWDEGQATADDDSMLLTRPPRSITSKGIPDWCPLEDAPR